jgi:hypothetical protein
MFIIINTFRNGVAGLFFSSVVEPDPHNFGGAVAATRCGSGSRIKLFYSEPHQNDAVPQHLFFLNRSILNIRFGAGAASLYGSGCS